MLGFLEQPLVALKATALDLMWPALAFAALALLVRGLESLKTARAAAGEVRTNLLLCGFDVVVIAPALALVLGAIGAAIARYGLVLPSASLWANWPAPATAVAALFVGDFIAYWRHRFEHTALVWPAHAIHHSDTAMTWTTGVRFHPINRFTTGLIDVGALALIGFPPWALMFNNLVRHYYGLFIHMDLPWTYGPLGRVLVSPAMHRWHHVRDAKGAGVNFATVFSVFDQAFGTHHVPGPCDAQLGVREAIGKGALAQLMWPFKALVLALRPQAQSGANSGRSNASTSSSSAI